jgi:predicted SnoaL-like aldol condensation-catalyzing enzyme/ketosteroid isomerase-like protein
MVTEVWRTKVIQAIEEKNKALVLEAFDTLFNKRDYAAAERYWSPGYIQHSAHIAAGRDGLFDLIRSAPPTLKYEPGTIVAERDYVIVHGRFSGIGQPVNWIAADILRIADGVLVERWDVIEDEATRKQSASALPMFGDTFPAQAPASTDLTSEEVSRTHREGFYGALRKNDLEKLSQIYSDDYMLVRPDGSALSKAQILDDLKSHAMSFNSIELTNEKIRVYGPVGVLTGDSRITTVRDGRESKTGFRLVAVYHKHSDRIELVHFQSSPLPA